MTTCTGGLSAMTDLHLHSTASDGRLSPTELAELCHERGIRRAALTDHDTIAGTDGFRAACTRLGIATVTGVEFSARQRMDGEDIEVHILGYGFDPKNDALQAKLRRLRLRREEKLLAYLERLRGMGIDIGYDEVIARTNGSPGRPHIAHILIERGIAADKRDAFKRFLWSDESLGPKKMRAETAAALILGAGGLPVFAHPGRTKYHDIPAIARELKRFGVRGIEAYYPTHSDDDVRLYASLARELGMLVTAGTDFHEPALRVLPGSERRCGEGLEETVSLIFDSDINKKRKKFPFAIDFF